MQFGRKKALTDYLFNKGVIFILVVIVIFLVMSVYERYTIEREMAARRATTEAEFATLEARREQLESKVEYLSGERGIEEEVRKNFDVAKDGEQVVILLGDGAAAPDEEAVIPVESPWYLFWR